MNANHKPQGQRREGKAVEGQPRISLKAARVKKLAEIARRNFEEADSKDRVTLFCERAQIEAAIFGQNEPTGDQQENLEALRAKAKDYLRHLRGRQ